MDNLQKLAKLVRYFSLTMSTKAGSGHPTSSLSATDLMVALMFGGYFRFDIKNSAFHNNDRLIFSKGHASPLFYALWTVAGGIEEKELDTYRQFGSRLEGHPTLEFPFTEVPTGSLGQGLSVGVGMALNAKLDKLDYKTFVLLGDSEVAEGSIWEAMASAAHYKLDNLVAILDVNRLGQRGETMYGHHTEIYQKKAESFGWETIVIDGHNFDEIDSAYKRALTIKDKPVMIVAKTLKGKGISFLEDKDGWHGKALPADDLKKALEELGEVDRSLRGELSLPKQAPAATLPKLEKINLTDYPKDKPVATRKAFGNALVNIYPAFPNMVVLDAEVSNSTFAEIFQKAHQDRFFEMFIAEQNMVGVATGLDKRGKLVFASTFAAFFARAFDQIRMSQYAQSNIKYVQSHCGVSIGEDGASQMALEDLAMFRTLLGIVVLYPSDAVSEERLIVEAAKHQGNVYIRNTRKETPIIYEASEEFPIGGSKVLKSSDKDIATVIGAGATLHEALKAYEELKSQGILIRVIDLYSIKPLDTETLKKAAAETKAIITVEDHYPEGGIGEAVAAELSGIATPVVRLAVRKMPRSGKPDELFDYEEINSKAIIERVKNI